jgi:phage FluMu protein Com
MPVKARCPGCGKHISATDKAIGHKAKCPGCGHVIEFHADAESLSEDKERSALEFLERGAIPPHPQANPLDGLKNSAAAPASSEALPADGEPQEEPASAAALPTPSASKTKTSVTTIDRMMAKTSRYTTLRVLAAVCFVVGLGVAILIFLGGATGLVILSIQGHALPGVGVFVLSLVLAGVAFLAAKVAGDILRVAADVGDETRRIHQMLDEHLGNHRERV